jgi:serine protease
MHFTSRPFVAAARAVLVAALTAPLVAAAAPEARVIVAFKPDAAALRGEVRPLAVRGAVPLPRASVLQTRADRLAAQAGEPLIAGRALTERWQVVRGRGPDSAALAARLAAHPDVAWAVPDQRRRAFTAPNDPLFAASDTRARGPAVGQWYLRAPDSTLRSAANVEAAWARRPEAGAGIVIAVIDTGVRPDHPDLQGRLLPGIDTIDDLTTANDGDGPDGDASDPGDWITSAEDRSGPLAGCGASSSSWHGTQVSTIAGASTNDTVGMAGAAWGARILPVRVLGKCGGYDSDIIAGMLWAAGLESVAGIVNAHPARVLNLSLGGGGTCNDAYRDAVARINAAGAVVVAAAGNDAGRAVGTPANCPGVIGVGGLRHAGTKVGFSDLGPEVAISAPGGNCVFDPDPNICTYPIVGGTDTGAQRPESSTWTDSIDYGVGTSFASPIVAGVTALMLSGRPALTAAEVKTALQASARPFPQDGASNLPLSADPVPVCRAPDGSDQVQCYCLTGLCGAGMLDGDAAVAASDAAFPRVAVLTASPTAGTTVQIDASGSLVAVGRSVRSYAWSITAGGGIVSGFSAGASSAAASLTPSGAGTFTVQVLITDDLGGTSVGTTTVTVAAANSGGSGGSGGSGSGGSGGGAMGAGWLAALALAALGLRAGPGGRPRR